MLNKKIIRIINEFRAGATKKQIQKKYGDVGSFAIEKFSKQNIEHKNLFKTFNIETYRDEDDITKEEIIKKFLNGEREKEIYKNYGEYGKLILVKFKELLSVPPI